MTTNAGFSGHFTLQLHQEDDAGNEIAGSRRTVADFDNLITNSGLDALAGTKFCQYCGVGSGSTAPANTDTALDTPVGSRISGSSAKGPDGGTAGQSDYYSSLEMTYVFAKNTVVGNLSEICTAPGSTGSIFSRALILDGSNNPTTITITPIDVLTVTYQLRLYIDTTDTTGSVTDGATTYTTTNRACGIDSYGAYYWYLNGPFGSSTTAKIGTSLSSVTDYPTAVGSNSDQGVLGSYSQGTYKRTMSFHFSEGDGNDGGPVAFFKFRFGIQTEFVPSLAKDNTKTLDVTFELSWGRKT